MDSLEIRHYLDERGNDPYETWRKSLRDVKVRIAVDRRVNRMELGNFGDHRFLRSGVWELRIDVGPGFRVYYALATGRVVLLLAGGDKGTQASDIDRACGHWADWQRRSTGKETL